MSFNTNAYLAAAHADTANAWASQSGVIITKRLTCADGFTLSVQASSTHYCTPRTPAGPWTHVEVGYPSDTEPLLSLYREGYCEDDEDDPQESSVMAQVPVEVVDAIVAKHGGPV